MSISTTMAAKDLAAMVVEMDMEELAAKGMAIENWDLGAVAIEFNITYLAPLVMKMVIED